MTRAFPSLQPSIVISIHQCWLGYDMISVRLAMGTKTRFKFCFSIMVYVGKEIPLCYQLSGLVQDCGNSNGSPLARHVWLLAAHALWMTGTFSPPLRVNDPDMHQSMCVTHVPWCTTGSLTSGSLCSRWREKGARHSWSIRNLQFYVSGMRPMC